VYELGKHGAPTSSFSMTGRSDGVLDAISLSHRSASTRS
jgi:hypothetical protein